MKPSTPLYKFKNACLLILAICFSNFLWSQNKKTTLPTFDEKAVKAVIDYMKTAGIPESEYEGYINFKRAEFEGKQNGTWEKPIVFKTMMPDSPVVTGCVNADFADTTFSSWRGSTGCHPGATAGVCTSGCCSTVGYVTGRHEIISVSGNDPVGGFPIIPPGRSVVVKLGNSNNGSQAEEISKSFIVTPASSGFTYWYAVVMQDGGSSHTAAQQPAFEIIMFDDVTGDTIPCSRYYVASGQNIPGFQTNGTTVYKPWSTVTLDLTNYINHQVTIRFRTFDCSLGGHYGYAYLSGDCFKSEIPDPYFCDGWNPDTVLNLTAPAGYSSYEWLKNGVTVANTQNITVHDPKLGDQYIVELTPYHTGNDSCGITLGYQIKLTPHPILPDYCPTQNIFTPNQDNKNENYTTHDYSWISKFNIKIYDRWGKLVFESEDPLKEWNGKNKGGDKSDDGVYYWHTSYVSSCYPDAEPKVCKGFVHLLR